MDIKISEIQSTMVDPRVMPELAKKQSESIPPVQKSNSASNKKARKDTEETAAKVQDYLQDLKISLQFKVESKTGDMVVQVVDKDTGEVVRQIPSEELIKVREKLEELRGVLFEGQV